MTNDEMMIVLKAGSEGKDIEFSHHKENNWHLKTSEWDFYTLKYRVKPVEPIIVIAFEYFEDDGLRNGFMRKDNLDVYQTQYGEVKTQEEYIELTPEVRATLTEKGILK